jgi:hypothetical protein
MAVNFAYKYLFHTCMDLQHDVKSYDMETTVLLPLRTTIVLRIFISIKNPSSSVGCEPVNLGSKGKHDH